MTLTPSPLVEVRLTNGRTNGQNPIDCTEKMI